MAEENEMTDDYVEEEFSTGRYGIDLRPPHGKPRQGKAGSTARRWVGNCGIDVDRTDREKFYPAGGAPPGADVEERVIRVLKGSKQEAIEAIKWDLKNIHEKPEVIDDLSEPLQRD